MAYNEVDYQKLDAFFRSMTTGYLDPLNSNRQWATRVIEGLIDSKNIEGSTAERMRDYLRDVHLTILRQLGAIANRLEIYYQCYINAYLTSADERHDSRFSSEELAELPGTLDDRSRSASALDANMENTLRGMSRLFTPATKYRGTATIEYLLKAQKNFIRELDETVADIEDNCCKDAIAEIDGMIELLHSYIAANMGHDHAYISAYTSDQRGASYHMLTQCYAAVSADMEANGEAYARLRNRIWNFGLEHQRDKDSVQYKDAARTIMIIGCIGDFCITGAELAVMATGVVPKPVVTIIGGAVQGGWRGYYTVVADQIGNYRSGDGALIDEAALKKSIVNGTITGATSALFTVGAGALFEHIGDNAFVYQVTHSESVIVKHSSGFAMKYLEKETSSICGSVTEHFVDTMYDNVEQGNVSKGTIVDAWVDASKLGLKEEFEEGGALKTGAETLVGYVIDEPHKAYIKGKYEQPEDLGSSHTMIRTLFRGGKEGVKSAASEFAGEFVEGSVKSGSVQGGLEQAGELITDETKRIKLIGGTLNEMGSGMIEDRLSQRLEQEIIDENRAGHSRERATAALGQEEPIPVDALGNPDYAKTSAIFTDEKTSIKAEVEVNTYGHRDTEALIKEANRKYGSRIGRSDFETPKDYRWVLKFDGKFGSQKATLQLVRGDKLPGAGA